MTGSDRASTVRAAVHAGLALALAIALAGASVVHERVGPAPRAWSQELCAPMPLHPCDAGVLQAGWPLAFLLDQPGVSVIGRLAFVEDFFRPVAFLLDVLAIWLVFWLARTAWMRGRRPDP